MAKKKSLIKAKWLKKPRKVAKLITRNKVASKMTDNVEIVVENKFLGMKNRDMGGWKWDYAYRPNGMNPVHIIAKEKKTGKYLLILQPRAPIEGKKLVLSFPAGLKDNKDEPAIQTAIREMKEETGFEPENIQVFEKPCPKSAGLTDESAIVVTCDIDGSKKNEPENEPEEDIYSMWMSVEEFWNMYPFADDIVIEYDLFQFMLGKK